MIYFKIFLKCYFNIFNTIKARHLTSRKWLLLSCNESICMNLLNQFNSSFYSCHPSPKINLMDSIHLFMSASVTINIMFLHHSRSCTVYIEDDIHKYVFYPEKGSADSWWKPRGSGATFWLHHIIFKILYFSFAWIYLLQIRNKPHSKNKYDNLSIYLYSSSGLRKLETYKTLFIN